MRREIEACPDSLRPHVRKTSGSTFTRQGPLVRSQYRPPNKIPHLRIRRTSCRALYGSWYGRCEKFSREDSDGRAWKPRSSLVCIPLDTALKTAPRAQEIRRFALEALARTEVGQTS